MISRQDVRVRVTPYASHVTSTVCSCAALALVFVGLAQFDLPIIHYVRSVTIHLPWDQLTVPWMAFTSNTGDWIGEGVHLLLISALFLAAGWMFSKPILKAAGVETLVGHGIAALLSNGLKHLLGRPRPKFVHSGEWQFTPSWAPGLDSFPSGHTTASFAIATVLAKRFPVFGPLCLSVAAFVAVSRIFRGAHFPTDVLGGVVLGVLSGSLASAPWREWKSSFADGLRYAAVGASAAFAVLWALSHHADEDMAGTILIGFGAVATASGFWLRRILWNGGERMTAGWEGKASLVLIAYGLASITTSPLVLASVGFACLASWFHDPMSAQERAPQSRACLVVREGALVMGVLMVLTILIEGRGVLPFQ